MSYSKPEQMSDQEFYISVEQVRSAINENYTCKRQTSTQLQIKVWAKKYTQKKLANIFVQRRVRPRPCHAESNQFLLPPSPGSTSTAICFNRYFLSSSSSLSTSSLSSFTSFWSSFHPSQLLTGGSSGFLLAKSAFCGTHALGHGGSRRRCRTVSVHGQEWGGFFALIFSWLVGWE